MIGWLGMGAEGEMSAPYLKTLESMEEFNESKDLILNEVRDKLSKYGGKHIATSYGLSKSFSLEIIKEGYFVQIRAFFDFLSILIHKKDTNLSETVIIGEIKDSVLTKIY